MARNELLLVRQPRWPKGRYSLVAGFIEPGETIESAVVRELKEEVGISVQTESVRYHHSQPWPGISETSPAQLMIACTVNLAATSSLHIDEKELEDGLWLDKATVRRIRDSSTPVHDRVRHLPGEHTAALQLINMLLESG